MFVVLTENWFGEPHTFVDTIHEATVLVKASLVDCTIMEVTDKYMLVTEQWYGAPVKFMSHAVMENYVPTADNLEYYFVKVPAALTSSS
jgi:hypothetical protein